jgi:diacylglycerol kinase (ATP)
MRKAALFYNPLSGRRRERRVADVNAAVKILSEAGVEISAEPTKAAAEASEQARRAIAQGCDTIFACGGDGTIHDVLQGLVESDVALGIIPLGTANALAHDLRLPLSAVGAARAALQSKPVRIAVGKIDYQDFTGSRSSRYFTVGAGIGLDAHLFYNLSIALKDRHGMAAYYAKAWHLWMTHKLRYFSTHYVDNGSGKSQQAEVTELLAVRITNFGGILRQLAPGASLRRNDLRVVMCKTASRTAYLSYVLQGLLNPNRKVKGIELAHGETVCCEYLPADGAQRGSPAHRIYVEADGELLGTIPARMSVVPNALTLLFPAS